MSPIKREDGSTSRNLLGRTVHPQSVYSRLNRLEQEQGLPTGGVRGGGDPTNGFPPAIPVITDVDPTATWSGTRWVLGLDIHNSYAPPPEFMYIEAEIAGTGFYHVHRGNTYEAVWSITDIGLVFGLTVQVRLRAALGSGRGYTAWSQPWTGVTFDSPTVPMPPDNLRLDPVTLPPDGVGRNIAGGIAALEWDAPGDGRVDTYTVRFWPDGLPGAVISMYPPTTDTKTVLTGLPVGVLLHIEVVTNYGSFTSDPSDPLMLTIPVTYPAAPGDLAIDTSYGTAGYTWGDDGVTAGVEWTLPSGAGSDPVVYNYQEIRVRASGDAAWRTIGPIDRTATAWLIPGLTRNTVTEAQGHFVSEYGDAGDWSDTFEFTPPAEDPPPPTSLHVDTALGTSGYAWTKSGVNVFLAWTIPAGVDPAIQALRTLELIYENADGPHRLLLKGDATSVMLPDLPRGVDWDVHLHTITRYGDPGTVWSNTITIHPVTEDPPAIPSFVITDGWPIAAAAGSVQVTWAAPAANVATVDILATPDTAGTGDKFMLKGVVARALTALIIGLPLGVPYNITATSITEFGDPGSTTALATPHPYTLPLPIVTAGPPNPSFEIPGLNGGFAQGWTRNVSGSSTALRSQAGGATDGYWAAELHQVTAGDACLITSDAFGSAGEGETFHFHFDYKATTGLRAQITGYDEGGVGLGVIVYYLPPIPSGGTGDWAKFDNTFTISGGVLSATNMKVQFFPTAPGTVYIDNISVKQIVNSKDLGVGAVQNQHLDSTLKGATTPGSPVAGDVFFDTTRNVWRTYTGSAWVDAARNVARAFDYSDRTVHPEPTSPTQISGTSTTITLARTAWVRIHFNVRAEKAPAGNGNSRIQVRDGSSTVVAPTNTAYNQAYAGMRVTDDMLHWDYTVTRQLTAGAHTLSLYAEAIYTTADVIYRETELFVEELYE